jgi:hypothetical protein
MLSSSVLKNGAWAVNMGTRTWWRASIVFARCGLALTIFLIASVPGYAQMQVVCQTPIGWCISISQYAANGVPCACLAGNEAVGGQSIVPQLAPFPYFSQNAPPPDFGNGSGAPPPLINPTKPWPCPTGYAPWRATSAVWTEVNCEIPADSLWWPTDQKAT